MIKYVSSEAKINEFLAFRELLNMLDSSEHSKESKIAELKAAKTLGVIDSELALELAIEFLT